MITRRALLAGVPLGLLAAPALAAEVPDDAAVITELLRAEHATRAVYAQAEDQARSGRLRALARRFRVHEEEHLRTLATQREALGAEPVAPPRPSLVGRHGDAEHVRALLAAEEELIAAYRDAIVRLRDGNLVSTAATILACQAQHAFVLRHASPKSA